MKGIAFPIFGESLKSLTLDAYSLSEFIYYIPAKILRWFCFEDIYIDFREDRVFFVSKSGSGSTLLRD